MSARVGAKSVMLACLGTLSGATAVLAATGTIHLTASRAQTTHESLDDVLGAIGDSTPTVQPSSSAVPATSGSALDTSTPGQPSGQSTGGSSASHTASPQPQRTSSAPQPVSGKFTGAVSWSNPYGPIQVSITVHGGKITDAQLVQMPRDETSQRINSQAMVFLREEVLSAQSANISWIGGASLTSPAYIESLSSAIANAHL